MSATVRVYVRTGIVGAWAIFIGSALVLTASRLLTVMETGAAASPTGVAEPTNLTAAAIPLSSIVWDVLQNLYSGGAVSVFVGIVLVLVGWFLILRSQ